MTSPAACKPPASSCQVALSQSGVLQVALCVYVHFGARVLLHMEVFLGLLLARLTDPKSQSSELQEAALEVRPQGREAGLADC